MAIIRKAFSLDHILEDHIIEQTLQGGLEGSFSGRKVLVLIPDHTRSLPLPKLFRIVTDLLSDTGKLDFMVALGTHPPLNESQMLNLVGLSKEERDTRYAHVGLLNHEWDSDDALKQIGVLSNARIREIAGGRWHPSLSGDVPVRVNKHIFEYDHLVILGPTFPHEVVGFSGGAKYLFPGISGAEMIDATHWLGALGGVVGTIGKIDTPVRDMIHAAAEMVDIPITLVAMVVKNHNLAALYIGDYLEAWRAAAEFSSQVHIRVSSHPYKQVLSHAPEMYDELWTAAKAMYKMESVVDDGGELIIYAPHMDRVSQVHGEYIYEAGYHTLDYFLQQWEKYKHIPKGVLAHSTHVRGAGVYRDGKDLPRIQVTLASRIPPEDCRKLNLGYLDPGTIEPSQWMDREDEGILYVPRAGEILYRLAQ
jgi:nickel-dependent lactate racemase